MEAAPQEVAVVATKKTSQPISALRALTASALSISGAATSQAATQPEETKVGLRFTQYQEKDLASDRIIIGSEERYSIDVLQMNFQTPLFSNYALSSYVAYETMSGASPYRSYLNNSGQTVVEMSGASPDGIQETRLDASLGLSKYSKYSESTSTVAISQENDYESIALSYDYAIENKKRWLALLGSASVSYDTLNPTDADLFVDRADATDETKTSISLYGGFNRVINKFSTLQMGIGVNQLNGYLSDPYRVNDLRPDSRLQTTFTTQYRRYSTLFGGAWHFDYRYYQDDWQVQAHTFDTSLWKEFSTGSIEWVVAPNLRYYWQHSAEFYNLEQDPTAEEFYSNDFRLSAYGAVTLGMDVFLHFRDFSLSVGFSQYQSDESWGQTGKEDTETPTLVDFTTFSFGLDIKI